MTNLQNKGHPLEIWAAKKGISTQEGIAVHVNMSAKTVFNIIRGKTVPRGQSIVNIERATSGEVTGKKLMDWYFDPKRNSQ